ncbi:MAG: Dak phosphatase, partial [Nocardioides sp.]|nr:Dak phosphatase [Nocardioides sp.]
AVTIAARQAMTMAGPCEPGDVLGVIAGDFAVVGSDLAEVAYGVLGRLLAGGGELVTLVSGEGSNGLADQAAAWVDEHHPHVDVVVYDGGQERYPLLLSVE